MHGTNATKKLAVGWAVGSAVGSTQRTVAKAFNSGGSAAEEEV